MSTPVLTISSVKNQAFSPSNVFSPGTSGHFTVNYTLSQPAQVDVTVTDSQGTLVQTTSVPTVVPGKEIPVRFNGAFSNGDLVDVSTYAVTLTPSSAGGRAGTPYTTQCATYY
jgi:hypothetical protein